jgi:acyl-CoA thioesterase-2
MDHRLAELLKQFELERLEVNLFRGESRDIGSPQVFGGQVLGQALMAAYATIEGRVVHSLHAYFLRRGDFNAPIVYDVDRSRDGKSFSTRRVVAIQHGEQIFNFAASFQLPETGLNHQLPMPTVPPPESLADLGKPSAELLQRMPVTLRRFLQRERPFDFRSCEPILPNAAGPTSSVRNTWFRAVDRCPDDDALHRCLLAYVSDYTLLDAALSPHAAGHSRANLAVASLDHAMWFHRPMRVDDWLLYSTDSPSASGARGFARGFIFSRDGRLVASTAQEGLMRVGDSSR